MVERDQHGSARAEESLINSIKSELESNWTWHSQDRRERLKEIADAGYEQKRARYKARNGVCRLEDGVENAKQLRLALEMAGHLAHIPDVDELQAEVSG